MSTQTISKGLRTGRGAVISRQQWMVIGLTVALAAIVLVLIGQALALSIWPETATFKPLDNYVRTAVFTLVPALIATALFARLARTSRDPVGTFLKIALIVLLLSFIPDFLLPLANKSLLGSSIAAFLHVIAAVVIVGGLIIGYRRAIQKA